MLGVLRYSSQMRNWPCNGTLHPRPCITSCYSPGISWSNFPCGVFVFHTERAYSNIFIYFFLVSHANHLFLHIFTNPLNTCFHPWLSCMHFIQTLKFIQIKYFFLCWWPEICSVQEDTTGMWKHGNTSVLPDYTSVSGGGFYKFTRCISCDHFCAMITFVQDQNIF